MDARSGQADQSIAWSHERTVDDRIECHNAERRADQIESVRRGVAAKDLRDLADLTARDLDTGIRGPGAEPDRQLAQELRVGALHRHVVE